MWGYSLQTLQTVAFWLVIMGAVSGGISVFASLASAIVSRKASVETQKVSDEAQKQADVRIAEANATAATANERAKSLEKELAQARLEILKLQKITQWRTLSHDDVEILYNQLQGLTLKLQIIAQSSDPEAAAFAFALHSVFRDLGFNVGSLTSTGRLLFVGVQLSGPPDKDRERLRSALSAIGIKVDILDAETYALTIGSKFQEYTIPKFQVP